MGTDDTLTVSLDQPDHHLQHRIVAARQQGADRGLSIFIRVRRVGRTSRHSGKRRTLPDMTTRPMP